MDPRTHIPLEPLQEWFVAFVDYGENIWWHRFCRRGFRHCFAFAFDARANRWIVFDPTLKGFFLRSMWGSEFDRVLKEVKENQGRVLRIACQGRGAARPRLFATCVTVIQHLVGVPGCAVRPDGLYRLLVRHGAEPALIEQDEGYFRRWQPKARHWSRSRTAGGGKPGCARTG